MKPSPGAEMPREGKPEPRLLTLVAELRVYNILQVAQLQVERMGTSSSGYQSVDVSES